MFGWFQIKSPLTKDQRTWIEQRFQWLRAQFGDERLKATVVTPSDEFFPARYSGTQDDASTLFNRVCELMGVNRARLDLKFYTSASANAVAAAYNPVLRQRYALGVYEERGGRIDIWLEATHLSDAASVVATMAHELGHVHLLADKRCDATTGDHEPLTDLLTVYFGLGVFAANTVLREANWRVGNTSGWSMSSRGYLKQAEMAYALALFAFLRGEDNPGWATHLRKDVRALLKAELKQLVAGSRVPFQNLLEESTDADSTTYGDKSIDAGGVIRSEVEQDVCDEQEPAAEVSDDEGVSNSSLDRRIADELFERGVALAALGEHELAVEAYTKSLEKNPRDEEVWSHRGRANLAVGRYSEAIDDCTKSLRIEPDDVDAHICRATAYLQLRKFADAVPDLNHVIREEGKDPRAWLLRGIANMGIREFKQAVKDINKAVRYAPTWADNYLARSRAYEALGDWKRSQADLFEAIRRDPRMKDESQRAARLAGQVLREHSFGITL